MFLPLCKALWLVLVWDCASTIKLELCKGNPTQGGASKLCTQVSSGHNVSMKTLNRVHNRDSYWSYWSPRLIWGHLLPPPKLYGLTRERKTQWATGCHSGSPPCWSWRGWAQQHRRWLSKRLGRTGPGSSPALLEEEEEEEERDTKGLLSVCAHESHQLMWALERQC